MPEKHIFLIDDDIDDQELFLSALEQIDQSWQCNIAANGHDAWQKLSMAEQFPGLIVLDLNMPLMNGQQFLERMQQVEAYREIPVIIFTTTSNPHTANEVKKLGAKALFTKPNSFSELINLLQHIITKFATA